MKQIILFIPALIISLIFTSGVSSQNTVMLYPEQDNSMFQVPNRYSNATGPEIYSGTVNNGSTLARRALIQFSFADIPAEALITDVQLGLYCTKTSSSGNTSSFDLHRLLESWGEESSFSSNGQGVLADTGDVTWKDRFYDFDNPVEWIDPGGTFFGVRSASLPVNVKETYYTWTDSQLVADVQDMLANPTDNHGWILKATDESVGGLGRAFASRENADSLKIPRLEVTYVIPTSVDELESEYALKVFPNPGNNVLNIETSNSKTIQQFKIIDLNGRVIKEGELTSSPIQINTVSLKAGYYFIRFPDAGDKTIRWVKQ